MLPEKVIVRYLGVKALAEQGAPGERDNARKILARLRKKHPGIKQQAAGRPVVFVMLPTMYHVDEALRLEQLARLGLDATQFERGLLQRRMIDVADEVGVAALDATPVLAEAPDVAAMFLQDRGHLSVRGNELVGNWLAGQFVRLLR